ncbi:MAG: peptidase [Nitrosopumilaceae archaeon]|jgi:hypothetical protein
MKSVFVVGITLILIGASFPLVYGHGLGEETLPLSIGERQTSLSVGITPSIFDSENKEKYVTLRLSDKQGGFELIIEHVTFVLELKKDGKQIFKEMFHDEFGNLTFRVITNDSEKIEIDGIKEPNLGGWMRSEQKPLTLSGPIFTSGGLYEYKIEILTVDSDNNVLDEKIVLEGAISLAEFTSVSVNDSQDQPHDIQIISYFDSLNDINFESNQISFSMPFDWNQDFEQLSVIHEEFKIPNTFEEFLSTKYNVVVNGIPMQDEVITIDDYSVYERTVHVVLNKAQLKQIRQNAILESDSQMNFILSASEEEQFPLKAITPDYRYEVFLSWDPETIRSGAESKFFIDIQGMFREKEKTGPIEYDLELLQNDSEIYSKHLVGTINSDPDEHKIKFDSQDVGSVNLVLSNIGGNSLATANFIFVIYPEDTIPDFPLTFQSMYESNGEIVEGNFDVDVTWFPSSIEPGESEFVLTFYQTGTKIPVKNTTFDFILIQNNSQIFKTEGLAKSGGTFENYVFDENELGDVTVRIENIAGTEEFVEIPIVVTPEFPTVFLIFIISMMMLVLFKKPQFSKISI